MIEIETDEVALSHEMLICFHERKPLNVCGNEYMICNIEKIFPTSDQDGYVKANGQKVIIQPWNGQGLPPVGAKGTTDSYGEVFTVFGIDGDWLAVAGESTRFWIHAVQFKPIKTKAQIYWGERITSIETYMADLCISEKLATVMYDKGYRLRKQEGE